MTRVGVALSGCGRYDGAEIHESVLTLFFLDKAGAEIICMAPDIDMAEVIDHIRCEPVSEKRNVLTESSRIARGSIRDMKDIKESDLDALVFPGGLGAEKNLCSFAAQGIDCTVNVDVKRLIGEMHAAKKPIGFICIAPLIAAKVLGAFNPRLTIGNDGEAAEAIEKMGGTHIESTVDNIVVDMENKLITTPAYMLGPTISKVALGIEKLVSELLRLA